MGPDLGTPRPLLSIHQSGASGVHTAASEGWLLIQIAGQRYVLIRNPHGTNKYWSYTIHNTVRIRNLEYLSIHIIQQHTRCLQGVA